MNKTKFNLKTYQKTNRKLLRSLLLPVSLMLIILITGFIFSNSLQDGETSNTASESVAQTIRPILDPQEKVEEDKFHVFTRKLAHGIEFCALGCSIGWLMWCVSGGMNAERVFTALFCLLSVAVTDEYIQSFTGRTSCVEDILIDFVGGLTGLILTAAGVGLWKRTAQKRENMMD